VPESDLGGQRDDIFEVAGHGRLAAVKMQLEDPELGGLLQHVKPHARLQLMATRSSASG
jgi:hypothetical protein